MEDIIDSGRTLSYLIEVLKQRKPNSLRLCTLLDKPERRVKDVKVDYVCFNIPDEFVVGLWAGLRNRNTEPVLYWCGRNYSDIR